MKAPAQNIASYDYGTGQVNPYAQGGDLFYQPTQNAYAMPVSWRSTGSKLPLPSLTIRNQLNFLHYAPMAPYPQKLLPFQKNIHSFFLSDNIREELQRKGEAALQTMPSKPAFETDGRARPR